MRAPIAVAIVATVQVLVLTCVWIWGKRQEERKLEWRCKEQNKWRTRKRLGSVKRGEGERGCLEGGNVSVLFDGERDRGGSKRLLVSPACEALFVLCFWAPARKNIKTLGVISYSPRKILKYQRSFCSRRRWCSDASLFFKVIFRSFFNKFVIQKILYEIKNLMFGYNKDII
jgi:hypothetical protein